MQTRDNHCYSQNVRRQHATRTSGVP